MTTDQVQQILDVLQQGQAGPASKMKAASLGKESMHKTKDEIPRRVRASKVEFEFVMKSPETRNKATAAFLIYVET
ncbi:hypothetical protein FOPE_07746 [Fonsecaea pedrosoi]|nr:hypothetical protein FOPE_07746 [Fonsecaea pedrosoi]